MGFNLLWEYEGKTKVETDAAKINDRLVDNQNNG